MNPDHDTPIDQLADLVDAELTTDARDAFYLDAIGAGYAPPTVQELVAPDGRPMVTITSAGHRMDRGTGAMLPETHEVWLMPFWMAATLHGVLDQMAATFPPEIQGRWRTARERAGGHAAATLPDVMAQANRGGEPSTDVSAHNREYGAPGCTCPVERGGLVGTSDIEDCPKHGPMGVQAVADAQSPEYGAPGPSELRLCGGNLDYPPHPIGMVEACPRCAPGYRCGFAGGLCGLPIDRLNGADWQHIAGAQNHDAVGPDAEEPMATGIWCSDHPEFRPDSIADLQRHADTVHAREMAGARGEDAKCERCAGVFDPIAVCAEHGWCSRCHEPEAQPWHRPAPAAEPDPCAGGCDDREMHAEGGHDI